MTDRDNLKAFIRIYDKRAQEQASKVQYMQKCLAKEMKKLANTMEVIKNAQAMLKDIKPRLRVVSDAEKE